ncbi:MAG: hypothetical protein WBB19_20640 [Desulforhopalus sp.]
MTATIKPLKRVTLSLTAGNRGSEPEKTTQNDSPVTFTFIHGVASSGLCPFEAALHDKREGEKLALSISTGEAHEYFGYLFPSLRQVLGLQILPETINMNIEVNAVADADNREVVQSLAKALAGCGCGDSCGCGC